MESGFASQHDALCASLPSCPQYAGKTMHSTQIELSPRECPEGILGADPVPPDTEAAAHGYDLRQFALLEPELKKAEAKSASPAAKAFASRVRSQIAEVRRLPMETSADQDRHLAELAIELGSIRQSFQMPGGKSPEAPAPPGASSGSARQGFSGPYPALARAVDVLVGTSCKRDRGTLRLKIS